MDAQELFVKVEQDVTEKTQKVLHLLGELAKKENQFMWDQMYIKCSTCGQVKPMSQMKVFFQPPKSEVTQDGNEVTCKLTFTQPKITCIDGHDAIFGFIEGTTVEVFGLDGDQAKYNGLRLIVEKVNLDTVQCHDKDVTDIKYMFKQENLSPITFPTIRTCDLVAELSARKDVVKEFFANPDEVFSINIGGQTPYQQTGPVRILAIFD